MAFNITKIFVMCDLVDVSFVPNIETLQCKFFARDNLPNDIATVKCSLDQYKLCFSAYDATQSGKSWVPDFD